MVVSSWVLVVEKEHFRQWTRSWRASRADARSAQARRDPSPTLHHLARVLARASTRSPQHATTERTSSFAQARSPSFGILCNIFHLADVKLEKNGRASESSSRSRLVRRARGVCSAGREHEL